MSRFPNLPPRMRHLPLDHRGFPVPWFVAWIDGAPDFRVIAEGKIRAAVRHGHCWLCGEKVGAFKTFVIGPMCAVNRVSAEPPSHLECAVFAAEACPFLTRPKMRRNEKDMPAESKAPAGEMIARNPGVALLWTTKRFQIVNDGRGGVLFDVGEPHQVRWYAEGRQATRKEVLASIESGLPLLTAAAKRDGLMAMAELGRRMIGIEPLLPVAA